MRFLFFIGVLFFSAHLQADLAVWSEFLSHSEVEQELSFLKSQKMSLHLAVHPADIQRAEIFELMRSAERVGVEVRPWILLDEADGYWANIWNAEKFRETVLAFLNRVREEKVQVSWISIDLESQPNQLRGASECLSRRDVLCASKVFGVNQDSKLFWQAHSQFQKMIEEVRALGYKLHAVAAPLLLHDLSDSKGRIQFLLGVPLQGLEWDEVSFMVYRPEFKNILGEIGSDIVYEYARMARFYFGFKAAIDLGEIGESVFPISVKGFQKPEELLADIRAVKAAGISEINLYSLDGLSKMSQPELWVESVEPQISSLSWKTKLYFAAIDILKRMLPSPRD